MLGLSVIPLPDSRLFWGDYWFRRLRSLASFELTPDAFCSLTFTSVLPPDFEAAEHGPAHLSHLLESMAP